MPDVFTKAKRSAVMSLIRGRGNKDTEIALVRLLRQNKITGWRRHLPIFGRPDFAFPKQKLVVFVDGCFWHGCPKHCKIPAGNRAFWKKKFAANQARDHRVNRKLRKLGWRIIRIWEHDLSKRGDACARRLAHEMIRRARVTAADKTARHKFRVRVRAQSEISKLKPHHQRQVKTGFRQAATIV